MGDVFLMRMIEMSVCPVVGFYVNIRINLQSYTKNPAKILIGIDLYLEIAFY